MSGPRPRRIEPNSFSSSGPAMQQDSDGDADFHSCVLSLFSERYIDGFEPWPAAFDRD